MRQNVSWEDQRPPGRQISRSTNREYHFAVSKSVFKTDFIDEQFRARAVGVLRHQQAIREKNELSGVIDSECPEFALFLHAVEVAGDVDRGKSLIKPVATSGCVAQDGEHLTGAKVLAGATAWRLRIRSFGIAGVIQTDSSVEIGESWHTISLRVRVKDNRVDTEFFAWNEQVGSDFNETDDPEKFHIVWEVDNTPTPRLVYAGFGTNQPYNAEHPHSESFSHRPRYRVFDRDSGESYEYIVAWHDCGPFDRDWSHKPVVWSGDVARLEFVSLPDDSRLCLSDREVVAAGDGLDGFIGWCDALKAAGGGDLIRRWTATVKLPAPSPIDASTQAPDLLSFVARPGQDYLAYFVALRAHEVSLDSAATLRSTARQLGNARSAQYEMIVERSCHDLFVPAVADVLPPKMGDLLGIDTSKLPQYAAEAVTAWRHHVERELRRDVYYYSQDVIARMNRLRFAASIALDPSFGDVYSGVLRSAIGAIQGTGCFGRHLASL